MTDPVTLGEFHERLVRDTLGSSLDEAQAFLIFFLLHHYLVELMGPVLSDSPGIDRIHGLTQRGSAGVLAAFWPEPGDPRRTDEHWYWKWNTDWNNGHSLSEEQSAGLRQLILRFETHRWVSRIILDED